MKINSFNSVFKFDEAHFVSFTKSKKSKKKGKKQ